MTKILKTGLLLLIWLSLVSGTAADKLPKGALLIEQRNLPKVEDRALVLWMIEPKSSMPTPQDEEYTCPAETRGNSYSGPTRVSLVDTKIGRVINTIEIRDPHFPESDTFDIPHKIRPGYYYHVNSRVLEREYTYNT